MLKKLGIAVLLLVVVLGILVATRPDAFRVERSVTVTAPAEVVFAQLNDFHLWSAWSPWEKMDPGTKKTYGGSPAGTGATYHWVGEKVGEGQMSLTESKPHEHLAIKLEFLKPFQATNDVEFNLKPASNGVSVSWSMVGKNNFLMKAFSLFVNMDERVGKDFENGLAELKQVSEAEAARRAEEARKLEAAKTAEAPAAAVPAP